VPFLAVGLFTRARPEQFGAWRGLWIFYYYSISMALPNTKDRLGSPLSIPRLFALVRSVLPIGLGIFLWLTPSQPGALLQLGPRTRLVLAGIFILYGLYRLVRTIRTQFLAPPPTDDID
jgi:hypothetical protein